MVEHAPIRWEVILANVPVNILETGARMRLKFVGEVILGMLAKLIILLVPIAIMHTTKVVIIPLKPHQIK